MRKNQSGLVSIIITSFVLLLMGLIVLGFGKIVNREQRQALDRQLNTQAQYAAESGVSQAIKAIRDYGFTGDKPTCAPLGGATPAETIIDNKNVDESRGVEITCIIINNTPGKLEYGTIGTDAKTIPLVSQNGTPLDTLTLTWQKVVTSTATPASYGCSAPQLPPAGSWNCSVGILRVDLVPTSGSLTRDSLSNNMYSALFYPTNAGASPTPTPYSSASGPSNQGLIVQTRCNNATPSDPAICSAKITGLSSPSYHMRIRSLYEASTISIEGTNNVGTEVSFTGAQSLIDSTGKASDVLRRVQVRTCSSRFCGDFPDYTLQTSDICKRYLFIPTPGGNNGYPTTDTASCVLPP